jgi:hypothetical protein
MQKASVPTIDSIVGDHILEVCIDTTCLLSTTTQKIVRNVSEGWQHVHILLLLFQSTSNAYRSRIVVFNQPNQVVVASLLGC